MPNPLQHAALMELQSHLVVTVRRSDESSDWHVGKCYHPAGSEEKKAGIGYSEDCEAAAA